MTGWILAGCGAVLAASFGVMASLGDLFWRAPVFLTLFGVACAAYALAVARIVRRPPADRRVLLGILAGAAVFRLLLLPTAPSLSTDLYRYVWDGRLAAAGVSPYRYAPSAPEVVPFRDETVYPRLNHADWRTIYPPGAQLLFAGMAWLAPERPLVFKLLVFVFDAATIGLLVGWLRALGRPPAWVLLYAWHPLVVVELAGSSHLDAVVLATSVAALWAATRGREEWAGALVGAGALVKLYPALLLPAVLGRRPGRTLAACAAVIAAGYGLYAREGLAVLGSLARYVTDEEFNGILGVPFDLLRGSIGPAGFQSARLLPLAGLLAAALAIGFVARDVPPERRALWLVGAYLIATPNLFPWYTLWIVPVLAAVPAWPWLYLTGAVGLTYVAFPDSVWRVPGWVTAVEFGPLALGLGLAAWSGPVRPQGAVPDGSAGPEAGRRRQRGRMEASS